VAALALKEKLVTIKPIEMGGSRAANRLEYQRDYALCCLIELHLKKRDYRILFDYHDDIVILFPSNEPSELHFYQVKTDRTNNWSLGRLLKRKNPKGGISLSILGKMFSLFQKFAEHTASLNFVSNANFNFKLKDQSKSLAKNEIYLIDLAQQEFEVAKKKITDELSFELTDELAKITVFKVSSLSLDDHSIHVLGKLTDFLVNKFNDPDPPANSLFRVLKGYIEKKQNSEIEPQTFGELFQSKSISYQEIESILQSLSFKKKFAELWEEIRSNLQNENCNYKLIQDLHDECDRYLLERTNPTNDLLQGVRQEIKNLLSDPNAHKDTLLGTVGHLAQGCPIGKKRISDLFSETFFKAMILVEIYDK